MNSFCDFLAVYSPVIVGVLAIIVALVDAHKSGRDAQKQITEIKELCRLQMKSNQDAIELEIARLEVEISKTDAEIITIEEMLKHTALRSVITLHENPNVLRVKKDSLINYRETCQKQITKLRNLQ